MSQVLWQLSPVDSWFFRNGKPFSIGASIGVEDTIFPPPMTVLQGAIRTAIARQQGWTPDADERWPSALGTSENLGQVVLRGPVVTHQGRTFFPFPRHILRGSEGFAPLVPGPLVATDLGERRLPVLPHPNAGVKSVEDTWVDANGLRRVLEGGTPQLDEVKQCDAMWRTEVRTSLQIDAHTGTAEDSRLFHTAHTRLLGDTSLTVEVHGVPADWQVGIRFAQVGGEGRFAAVQTDTHASIPIPPLSEITSQRQRYCVFVMLLTPGVFQDGRAALHDGPVAGMTCISAVIGRVEMRGGWDLRARRPRPLRAFIPAGSVWFYQLTAPQWEQMQAIHNQHVGLDPEYGYGHVVLGQWKDGGQ